MLDILKMPLLWNKKKIKKKCCTTITITQICFLCRCTKSISSIFLTTFGICFTFLLYIFTGALVLFSFETGLEGGPDPGGTKVRSLTDSWAELWKCCVRFARASWPGSCPSWTAGATPPSPACGTSPRHSMCFTGRTGHSWQTRGAQH